jgi:Zn-dependent peptidase ImmA (M78 family)/DNA-binding XRE family transcriptional regulator
MIGARLKLAREAAGLSLRALSNRIDNRVSAQAIGRYENDRMMPGSEVLLALARALGVAPEYLLSRRDISLSGVEFRRAPGAGAKEERAVEARVLEQLERHLTLEETLGLDVAPRQTSLARLDPIDAPDQAQDAAATLRSRWHLGTDPIPSMTELLEERGIKVIALDLPIAVSGSKTVARLASDRSVLAVIINSNHTGERQRFTLAHELGHLVLDVSGRLSKREAEKAMDRFAGAFLVADEELRRLAGAHRSDLSLGELVELKRHFRVSLQCLVVRLGQTGILSEPEQQRHWQMLKDHGFLEPPYPEPEPLDPEKSHRLHRLAMRAVSEGALSESKAAEVLGISARVLNRWLDAEAHATSA